MSRSKAKRSPTRSITPADIPVVIFAGGRGTRLMEETQLIPKPMVTIGGMPILLHIMRYYSTYGFRKFIICLGYKGSVIKNYFLDLPKHMQSLVINVGSGRSEFHRAEISDWTISLIETGENSLTGTRLRKVAQYIDAPHFCLTYGDGVGTIDLDKELAFHLKHGRLGTVSAVHPPSRFGRLEISGSGVVTSFREKEMLPNDHINGGFFMFRKEFLKRLPKNENVSLEAEPLVQLAEDGELSAYRHEGFWMCMDTLRDRETLEQLVDSGNAPWMRWK